MYEEIRALLNSRDKVRLLDVFKVADDEHIDEACSDAFSEAYCRRYNEWAPDTRLVLQNAAFFASKRHLLDAAEEETLLKLEASIERIARILEKSHKSHTEELVEISEAIKKNGRLGLDTSDAPPIRLKVDLPDTIKLDPSSHLTLKSDPLKVADNQMVYLDDHAKLKLDTAGAMVGVDGTVQLDASDPIVLDTTTAAPLRIRSDQGIQLDTTQPLAIDTKDARVSVDTTGAAPLKLDAVGQPVIGLSTRNATVRLDTNNTAPIGIDTIGAAPLQLDGRNVRVRVDTNNAAPIGIDTMGAAPLQLDGRNARVRVDTQNAAPLSVDASEAQPIAIDTSRSVLAVDTSNALPLDINTATALPIQVQGQVALDTSGAAPIALNTEQAMPIPIYAPYAIPVDTTHATIGLNMDNAMVGVDTSAAYPLMLDTRNTPPLQVAPSAPLTIDPNATIRMDASAAANLVMHADEGLKQHVQSLSGSLGKLAEGGTSLSTTLEKLQANDQMTTDQMKEFVERITQRFEDLSTHDAATIEKLEENLRAIMAAQPQAGELTRFINETNQAMGTMSAAHAGLVEELKRHLRDLESARPGQTREILTAVRETLRSMSVNATVTVPADAFADISTKLQALVNKPVPDLKVNIRAPDAVGVLES